MVSQAVPLNTLAQEDCRSRKKPRERRFELRKLLFLRLATSRFLTFYEGVKIELESV